MPRVTDFKWKNKKGEEQKGFYMDGYLLSNLSYIPNYLSKAWDVLGIISGSGEVGVGKSTLSAQIGYLLAWLMAGGAMEQKEGYKSNSGEVNQGWAISKYPDKPVRFNLKENVVFSPEDLMKRATELFEKYGKGQVLIYDEGRAGLDSARAMTVVNKVMQDFFQECRVYGHMVLIVLPSFYNKQEKEFLYFFGKKRIGSISKYMGSRKSFSGRFTEFLPFDKKEYEDLKYKALKKKQLTRTQAKWKKQRDASIYLLFEKCGLTRNVISDELSELTNEKVTVDMVDWAVKTIRKQSQNEEEVY
jgi:hypothetical protein